MVKTHIFDFGANSVEAVWRGKTMKRLILAAILIAVSTTVHGENNFFKTNTNGSLDFAQRGETPDQSRFAQNLTAGGPSGSSLPACNDPQVVIEALKSRSEGRLGHIDNSFVELMRVESVKALGINNVDGSKLCKATFTCDISMARDMERSSNGPHPLTAFCFNVNQMNEAGNPYFIRYKISPSGEGDSTVVESLYDP